MSQNWPADPIGGDSGWSNYSFWLVTFTNRQGQISTATMFAASAADAINALNATIDVNMFGPLTNVSASPSSGTGVE